MRFNYTYNWFSFFRFNIFTYTLFVSDKCAIEETSLSAQSMVILSLVIIIALLVIGMGLYVRKFPVCYLLIKKRNVQIIKHINKTLYCIKKPNKKK